MREFQKGDTVTLRAEVLAQHATPDRPHTEAEIRAVMGQHGEVWLDHDLYGKRYWNQSDLVLIKAADEKPRI